MRSGRGKCPQCKEMIVVDLDAAELRCPFCNALLKKSAKSVAQVRAEEEAKAKAEAEAAAAAAPEEPVAEPAATPAEEPVTAPVEETVAAPAEESVPAAEPTTEPEVDAAPAEETVDEIGISDEELAMMDDVPAEEKAEESAPAEEPVDEIGISDEELAMMDDVPAEEKAAEAADTLFADEPSTEEAAPAAIDEPMVFGSIGAVDGDETPEEADAARIAAEEQESEPVEEDAPVNNNIALEDDVDPALAAEDLPMIEDAPAEDAPEAEESVAEELPAEDTPVEDTPAEDAPVDESPVEDAPAEEIPVADDVTEGALAVEEPTEDAAPAEVAAEDMAEETPAEELSVEEPAEELAVEEPAAEEPAEPADDVYVPTEEDMAFAASLSDMGRSANRVGFVATPKAPQEDKKQSKRKVKEAASEGEKSMKGSSVYKKPIAVIMMLFSILAAAVWFLYYKVGVLAFIPVDLTAVTSALPAFDMQYVVAAFAGLIAVVSILGLTGKKGKIGFLCFLLADLAFAAVTLFGATPIVAVEAIQKIVAEYGEYATYAIYGLMLLGAIFFAAALVSGKDDYDLAGGAAILPVIYLALIVAGYVALVLVPQFVEGFTVSAELLNYVILGVIGAALLMTLVGVHNGSLSRAVNGWLIFASVAAIALVNVAVIVMTKVLSAGGMALRPEIPYYITPILAIFGVAGFTAADLRN